MANLQIRDDLDHMLDEAATRAGVSKSQLAEEIISAQLEDKSLPLSAFSDTQINRLKESAEQIKRGEVLSSTEVDIYFEDLLKELDAK